MWQRKAEVNIRNVCSSATSSTKEVPWNHPWLNMSAPMWKAICNLPRHGTASLFWYFNNIPDSVAIQYMFCASWFKDLYRILIYTTDMSPSDICLYPVLNKTFLRCTANTKWQFAGRMLSLLYRDGHSQSQSPNYRTSREFCPPFGLFASYIPKTLQCKNIYSISDKNAVMCCWENSNWALARVLQ